MWLCGISGLDASDQSPSGTALMAFQCCLTNLICQHYIIISHSVTLSSHWTHCLTLLGWGLHTCLRVHKLVLWIILWNCARRCTMEDQSENLPNNSKKTFQIIAESMFLWRVYALCICQSWKRNFTFDLGLWAICQYHSCNMEIKDTFRASF